MRKQNILILMVSVLFRFLIPYVDLFLLFYFIRKMESGTDKTRNLFLFSIAAFAYSLIFEGIIGIFPLIFILVAVLETILFNKAPKVRTLYFFISSISILIITVLPDTLSHLLTSGAILIDSKNIIRGIVTIIALFLLQTYLSGRRKRI